MTRSRISGFEFTIAGYTFEIVMHDYIPCCLAIWKKNIFIKRWEVTP